MKNTCKYCKSTEHTIDTCPDILCKICNNKGHPHWKCVPIEPDNNNIVELKLEEKDIISPEKLNKTNNINDLKDYKEFSNIPWGEL
jgi:hypothetical protein